jgi:hypothetical protein
MARKKEIGLSLEIPEVAPGDRRFLPLLNEKFRQIASLFDELKGNRGAVTLKADLDMGGNRIVNVGRAKDSKDAVSLEVGNRRYIDAPVATSVNVTAVGGGTTSDPDRKATFGIGIKSPVIVETDITNHYHVRKPGIPFIFTLSAKTAPLTQALILDIKRSANGISWDDVFLVRPSLPIGTLTQYVITTGFKSGVSFAIGELLRIDCVQADGVCQDVEAVLEWQ